MSTKSLKNSRRSHLADAANELVASASDSSFDVAIFFEKFASLATVPNAIPQFRNAILEAAGLGLITDQKIDDGNGESLVEGIKQYHDALRNMGEIKSKKLERINASELPILPNNWIWASLGEIADYAYSEKVDSSQIPPDGWLLDLEDVEKDTSRILRKKCFEEKPSLSTKAAFAAGDVLYCKLRPYLNKVVVADDNGFCTTEIIPSRTFCQFDPHFLAWMMRRQSFVTYANSKSYGMNLPRLSTADARNAPIPVPPPPRRTEAHRGKGG